MTQLVKRRYLPSIFDDSHFSSLLKDFMFSDLNDIHSRETKSGVSMHETENNIVVELDMPGLNKDNIELSFEKGVLWVQGKLEEDDTTKNYHIKASRNYSYTLPIPSKIDENGDIEAKYEDGVVKVIFNKSLATQPKKIILL